MLPLLREAPVFERKGDQAEGLRRMLGLERVRTIALFGARGRAGTTTCIMNLAAALGQAGRSVLVVDEHYGPDNISGMLGLSARGDLKQVLAGDRSLREVLEHGPQGVLILPAANGARMLGRLPTLQRERAAAGFRALDDLCDLVLIDALAPTPLQGAVFGGAAQETVIVLEPDVTAITQAYALIKQLRQRHGITYFRMLVNRSTEERTAWRAFDNLAQAARGFLDAGVEYVGTVPMDGSFADAVRQFSPLADVRPASPAARSFQRLARTMLQWPARHHGADTPDQLFHRVIQTSRRRAAGAGA